MYKKLKIKLFAFIVIVFSCIMALFLTVSAAVVTLTVSNTVQGTTVKYFGSTDVTVDSARYWRLDDMINANLKSLRIWDFNMECIEGRHDDDNNYGSPGISQIKADSANGFVNTIPWSYWDGVFKYNTDYYYNDDFVKMPPLYDRLVDCNNAGILPVASLRAHGVDYTGNSPNWLPRPNESSTLTTEWLNEWWEYCFAVAYWCNVRNDLGITNWEILNEPNHYGQGFGDIGGSANMYANQILTTASDALHYAASFVQGGIDVVIHTGQYAGTGTDWATTVFNSHDDIVDVYNYHDYSWDVSNNFSGPKSVISSNNSDGVLEPLWISEWGTYSDIYNTFDMAKNVGNNMMSMAEEGILGATIVDFWDLRFPTSGCQGLIDTESGSSNEFTESAHVFTLISRALNGGKDRLGFSYTGSQGRQIVTRDSKNIYVLLKDISDTVTVDLSALSISSGTATVYEYSSSNKDKIVAHPSISSGRFTLSPSSNGFTLAVVSRGGKPQPPDGVTVSSIGNGSVSINWNSVSDASSYKIKYGTNAANLSSVTSSTTNTNMTVSGLTNDQEYYFAVIASNSNGDSETISKIVSAIPNTSGGLKAPEAPKIFLQRHKSGEVTLGWPTTPRASEYVVYWGRESGKYTSGSKTVKGLNTTITGLADGAAYYFVVKARNSGGLSSDSNEVSETPSSVYMNETFTGTDGTFPLPWKYSEYDNSGASKCTLSSNRMRLDVKQSSSWDQSAGFMYNYDSYNLTTAPLRLEADVDTTSQSGNRVYLDLYSRNGTSKYKITAFKNSDGSIYYRINDDGYDSGDVSLGNPGGTSGTLAMEVTDRSLRVYWNGAQIGGTINRIFNVKSGYIVNIHGGSGASGDAVVYVDNVKVTRLPDLMFYDDFEDGNADGWTPNGGTWTIYQPSGQTKEYKKTGTNDYISLAGDNIWTDYSVQARVNIADDTNGYVSILGRAQDYDHSYWLELKKDEYGNKKWWIWNNNGVGYWYLLASGNYTYYSNTYYFLKLKMIGRTLTAYISTDSGTTWQTLGSANDSTFASGKIGVRSKGSDATFDCVRVDYAPPQTTFYDDFEDGNADGWTTNGGTWAINQPAGQTKEYKKTGSNDYISLAGDSTWTDYSVQAQVNIADDTNGYVSILGRAQDYDHSYWLELKKDDSGNKKWWIWKNNGVGYWYLLASDNYTYYSNTYYYLKLKMLGSKLTAYISTDSGTTWQTLGSATDSTFTSGKIGVRSKGSDASFDCVRVDTVPQDTLLYDDFEDNNALSWATNGGTWSIYQPAGQTKEYKKTGTNDYISLIGDSTWTDYSVQAIVNIADDTNGYVSILGRVQDYDHFYWLELKKDGSGNKKWWIWKNSGGGWWSELASGNYTYSSNTYYYLKLKMVGDTLTAYISTDSGTTWQTLGSANDSTYKSGKVGVRSTGSDATFDCVKVKSEPIETRFYDDFDDGNTDGWTPNGGTWTIYQPAGQTKEYKKTGTNDYISLAGDSTWTDYSVQARVNIADDTNGYVSILGRAQDYDHSYWLELKKDNNGNKKWWIWRNNGVGYWDLLASGNYTYYSNTYYYLKLKMIGNKLTAFISTDSGATWQTLGSATDSTFTSGKIGVRSKGSDALFDYVRVDCQ